MKELNKDSKVGILGAGTMGTGIAQTAAENGHKVYLYDNHEGALQNAQKKLEKQFARLVEKGKLINKEAAEIIERITLSDFVGVNENCDIVFEAIIENLTSKKEAFRKLEKTFNKDTIFATNTSSLSVTAIASACENSERVIGSHFFYPAPVMPLVEIIPGLSTDEKIISTTKNLISEWGKITVLTKDTPGFLVNRIARPFYGEALRILEENIADVPTIDWAMKNFGSFKMGPFELMDLVGNDVNYLVTKTIFEQFYYDQRFKPSYIQKRLVDAKHFGRKTGKGFYNYSENADNPKPEKDEKLGKYIFKRILVMLINQAADIVFMKIATASDVDIASAKGLNYPKGLCLWADEYGVENVVNELQNLYDEYEEDRYRVNPLLKKMNREEKTFH